MNRLKLDFSLNSNIERKNFLATYLESPQFKSKPLTSEELETCANYVLWGRGENGKNVVQNKEIEIETRHKTWSNTKEVESLDALLETPTFNEQVIVRPNQAITKIAKENFNRTDALKNCPDSLKETFIALFKEIDNLDLLLNYYDLKTGKRIKPPREELLNRFTEEEKEVLKEKANHLTQFKYLKLRHLLVEKRKEQYSLKDSYSEPIQRILPQIEACPETFSFDLDIPVFPLGLKGSNILEEKLFPSLDNFDPSTYTEEDLKHISQFYWDKQKEKEKISKLNYYLDFTDLEHLYQFLLLYFEVQDFSLEPQLEGTTNHLISTINYYIKMADLSEIYTEILQLKMKRKKNQEIADYINQKYSKSYTANYISTIFKQKIIKKINESAALHEKIISNIFFPENFKKCTCCGRTLLRDADYFVKKTRASDGFTSRCKKCDKEARNRRKIK